MKTGKSEDQEEREDQVENEDQEERRSGGGRRLRGEDQGERGSGGKRPGGESGSGGKSALCSGMDPANGTSRPTCCCGEKTGTVKASTPQSDPAEQEHPSSPVRSLPPQEVGGTGKIGRGIMDIYSKRFGLTCVEYVQH